MSLIFLAYSNAVDDPLPTLSEEDDQVYRILTSRFKKGHFKLHRESRISLSKITRQLIEFKDELTVFLFSGHAGRDQLILEGGCECDGNRGTFR